MSLGNYSRVTLVGNGLAVFLLNKKLPLFPIH
jgi:hypothetical protein